MGLFGALASDLRAATYSPTHDFWYGPAGDTLATDAGVPVSEAKALTFSACFQGTRLIAETVASLGRRIVEQRADGTKVEAPTHPLSPLLRVQANPQHTAFEWFRLMTASAVLWGNGYAPMVLERGRIVRLGFWHPSRVQVAQTDTGRLVYEVQDPQRGTATRYTQDEVFHLRGFGGDGVCGYSFIRQARQAIGLALAEESHGARFFSQGARPGGILKTSSPLTKAAEEQNRDSWKAAHQGLAGAHQVAVLSGGLEWQAIGMSQEDAQFIQSRDFQVRDVCRWLNISEHFLRVALRPIYATPEQLLIELMEVTIRPWVVNWETQINATLLDDPARYFLKFNLDAVHRADLAVRGDFYATMVQNGLLLPNEIRELEDRPPIAGGDQPMRPANMTGGTGEDDAEPAPTKGGPPRQATAIVERVIAQAVARECAAIRAEATPKHLADVDGWRAWVDRFYARQAAYLAEALAVPLEAVRPYCLDHRAALLAEGLDALEPWAVQAPAALRAILATTPHTEGAAA